jgi:tRNA-dihydrouridine synthase
MLHAKNFITVARYRRENFDPLSLTLASEGLEIRVARNAQGDASLNAWLLGLTPASDRPLVAQLAGHDPTVLAEAARFVEVRYQGMDLLVGLPRDRLRFTWGSCVCFSLSLCQGHVDAIDLNLGCPQGIARKGRYGAFLLREPALVATLVKGLVASVACPVTVKMRLLESGSVSDTVAFARMLEACGAAAVTLHGRTLKQNKHACGGSDAAAILAVREALGVPLIANGGIEDTAGALALLRFTGAGAAMASEALLENPALFSPGAVRAAEEAATAAGAAAASAASPATPTAGDVAGPAEGSFVAAEADVSTAADSLVFGAEAVAAQAVASRQLSFCREYLEVALVFPPSFDGKVYAGGRTMKTK